MRVIIAAVITALLTAPAAAQYGVAPSAHPPYAQKAKSKTTGATSSYAYAREYRRSPHSLNPQHDVYVNGQYIGSDPDPRIRSTLAHEWRTDGGMR